MFRGNHLLVFGYYVLLNLSAEHRFSPLINVQLAFICTSDTFTRYGPAAVISGQTNADGNYNTFETNRDGSYVDTSYGASMRRFAEGVKLPELFGSELQFGATIQAALDGKAKHELLGTKKSVSSATHRICCNCNVTSDQRDGVFNFFDPACPLRLTTTRSHCRDEAVLSAFDNSTVSRQYIYIYIYVTRPDLRIVGSLQSCLV